VIETQIEQARANQVRAEADLERLKVTLDDARNKLKRAQELSAKNLIAATELEAAQVNVRSAEAQIRSSEASITQARASLRQTEVNLEHTVITAPIDGLVISRNVDRGQTVASSMQAPTLFVLAADLTKMQVVANLDESDVGRIRPGQHVSFRVDAYPAEDFIGTVTQVRLQPIMQQNVVTYATVILVPNPQLKLKPGMTANVNIEIARRNNVIRVPNSALRFRPTNDMFAALGQTPPEQGPRADGAAGSGRGGRGNANTGSPASSPTGNQPAASNPPAASQQSSPAGRATPSDRAPVQWNPEANGSASSERAGSGRSGRGNSSADGQGREGFGERGSGGGRGRGGFGGDRQRMQDLSPEQREQMMQRMRTRGADPSADDGPGNSARGGPGPAGRNGNSRPQQAAPVAERNPAATTIDALFGPLVIPETTGRVWLHADKQLRPIRLRLGISDGQATELLEGDLEPGMEVVTNVTTGNETRPTIQGGFPPFMGQPGRGGFGPGGPGGGNRGGGGFGRGGGL
jgi:HlyD family secretion protein